VTYQRHTAPRSLPGPDDTLRQTLPNGITILVRENFASPAVVVNGYLEVGAEDEPRGSFGLAGFVSDVMERGTRRRPFDQLYEEVESIGAVFGIGSGTHITSFGAKSLAEDLPLLLDILSDVIRHPEFPERQVEKARTEILTDLHERAHDTRRMASRTFYELAYPETHPYHWSQLGYPETISAVTREDLADFHARYFAPKGMVIVVVGGIKAESAAESIGDIFGDWDAERPERPLLPEVPPLAERREQRITLEEKTQSNLVMGWPGPARRDRDFLACHVANTVLGVFGMYGRLGREIRERNGLAYYVYSRIDGGTGPGPWRVIGGFDPSRVDLGLDLIVTELRRLRDERVPDDELHDSHSYLTGSLPLHLETNEGVSRSLLNIERHGLGLDYLLRYSALIHEVNTDDVQAAAQRWLNPDAFALAVAGPDHSDSALAAAEAEELPADDAPGLAPSGGDL